MKIKIIPTPNNKFNSLELHIEGDEGNFPVALIQVRPDIDGQELARLLMIACNGLSDGGKNLLAKKLNQKSKNVRYK
jgi:hypothetical protein